MPDLSITSLRGGMNNTDPAIGLPEDQCVLAQNVTFRDALLGERRTGSSAVSLPVDLSARDRIPFLYRHLPTNEDADAQLWALGVTGTATANLCRKTTTWATQTISDTPVLSGVSQYRWQAQTLHGKLFLAYPSDQDLLHVVDTQGVVRRVGLAEPAAPTVADSAGAGTFRRTRYYRARYTEQIASVTVRRSEPSESVSIEPDESHAGITYTRPALLGESETHWEVEASMDDAKYYVVATVAIGTTTYDDTTSHETGYAPLYELSETIGDYARLPSARYLTADEDRLIWAGSWDTADHASRVGWTPVYGADGVGNDERTETDTDPFKDLDTYTGGPITGLSSPTLGAIWVFKSRAIFKLVRTGNRANAYDAVKFSSKLGALHGSVVSGQDASGAPCVYFFDPQVGPCRIGAGGMKTCGEDIRRTWETINTDATVACTSLYDPATQQVIWNIATGASETPDTRLVLQVDLTREFADGVRKGWTVWTGIPATALALCLYADNLEANTDRSATLVPVLGVEGGDLVHLADTSATDAGTAYTATVTTRPYVLRSLVQRFQVRAATLCARSIEHSAVSLSLVRDFGLETPATATAIDLSDEDVSDVLRPLDAFTGSELTVAQFTFTDPVSPMAAWAVNRLDLRQTEEQGA